MIASRLYFKSAVLLLFAGIVWGLHMTISKYHSAMPAYAHLNLQGFVALFLFGIFCRLHPVLEQRRLALIQAWVWILTTIVLSIGVGLFHTGHEIGDPIAAVSSLVIFASAILFAWLVFKSA